MVNGLGCSFGHFSQGAVLWLMYGCVSVEIYATRAVFISFRALELVSAECGQGLLATLFAHWYAKDRESYGTAYCGTGRILAQSYA